MELALETLHLLLLLLMERNVRLPRIHIAIQNHIFVLNLLIHYHINYIACTIQDYIILYVLIC